METYRDSKLRTFNKIFRIVMHTATIALLLSTIWMKPCDEAIYPRNFVCVTIIILCHQVYDMFLKYNDYMIDWKNLPLKSANQLYFNKPLFEKQSKFLLIGNLVFGVISILTVASGYFILNR